MYDGSVDILVKGGNKNVDSSLLPCNVLLVAPRSVPYVIIDVQAASMSKTASSQL